MLVAQVTIKIQKVCSFDVKARVVGLVYFLAAFEAQKATNFVIILGPF